MKLTSQNYQMHHIHYHNHIEFINKDYDIAHAYIADILNLVKHYDFKLVKFSVAYIKYSYVISNVENSTLMNITNCSDYARYKKFYKLLYGV